MIPTWIDGVLQPVEKLEAHQRGLQHKAVSVFVMNGSHTLLQRRTLKKYHTLGLCTNSCCTHPKRKELGLNCAQRRLQEELGIIGVEPQYIDTIEYRAEVPPGLIENEVVEIFVANFTSVTIRPNPDEVMDYCWETLEDLNSKVASQPNVYTPWLKIYLQKYADKIFKV